MSASRDWTRLQDGDSDKTLNNDDIEDGKKGEIRTNKTYQVESTPPLGQQGAEFPSHGQNHASEFDRWMPNRVPTFSEKDRRY